MSEAIERFDPGVMESWIIEILIKRYQPSDHPSGNPALRGYLKAESANKIHAVLTDKAVILFAFARIPCSLLQG
jgi:hypothetical protein